jgi:hypothetical protein
MKFGTNTIFTGNIQSSLNTDTVKVKIFTYLSDGSAVFWDFVNNQWVSSEGSNTLADAIYVTNECWKTPAINTSNWDENFEYIVEFIDQTISRTGVSRYNSELVKYVSSDIQAIVNAIKSQTDKLTFNGNNSVRSDVFDISNSGLNIAISRIDDTVSSRAPASTALSNVVWTDARASKLDNLDATISSRGSQADVTAIKSKTDNLQFNANNFVKSDVSSVSDNGLNMAISRIDDTVTSRAPASTALSNMIWTDARASKLDNLDTTISSRAPASTALSNATWTDERAAKLDNLDATVSSRGSQADLLAVKSKTDNLQFDANNFIKSNVMDVSDTELNTAMSNMDIAVSSRASQSTVDAIKNKTDQLYFDASSNVKANVAVVSDPGLSGAINTISTNLDTTISSRADQDTVIAIKNKTDQLYFDPSSNVKANIADVSDIELNNAISNMDVAVSTRAPASTALSSAIWTNERAAKLDNLDITVSSRADQATVNAIKSQTDQMQFDANSFIKSNVSGISNQELNTAIGRIDDTISSRASQVSVDAIKSKTDQMQFDVNSNIKSNVVDVSDTELNNAISRIDDTITSRAPASTALSNTVWTDERAAKIDNLDTTVGSRATQTSVDEIKAQTDKMLFDANNKILATTSTSVGIYSLELTVKDDTDVPISLAYVYIKDETKTNLINYGRTDSNGKTTVRLNPGTYYIYVSRNGYSFADEYSITIYDQNLQYTIVGTKLVSPTNIVTINHNYGGEMALAVIDVNGNPIRDVSVTIYEKSDTNMSNPLGSTITLADGTWREGIQVPVNNEYVVVFQKRGLQNMSVTITT